MDLRAYTADDVPDPRTATYCFCGLQHPEFSGQGKSSVHATIIMHLWLQHDIMTFMPVDSVEWCDNTPSPDDDDAADDGVIIFDDSLCDWHGMTQADNLGSVDTNEASSRM